MPQGIDTPGVEELTQGNETSGVTAKGEGVPGEDGRPHHPRNRGVQSQRRRQGYDARAGSGGPVKLTAGHGSGRRQRGDPAQASRQCRLHQAEAHE